MTTTSAPVAATTPVGPMGGKFTRDARAARMLWRREMIRLGRNRLQIAMGLVTPLMFLLILGTGLEAAAGDLGDGEDVLVRVHSECLTGDIFGSLRCDCGPQLDAAIEAVGREGRGVVLYVRGHEGRGIGLVEEALRGRRFVERL